MLLPGRASLIPKLRDHYAEFLDLVSLVHLRLLALPTCVGLRYGRTFRLPTEAFLACRLQKTWNWVAPHPRTPVSACAYAVGRPSTKPLSLRYTVPSVVITLERRGRNVRLLSIDYASGASPEVPPHPALIAMAQESLGLRCQRFSL